MARQAKIIIKPGDDISWTGKISRTGLDSFDGYILKAEFRPKDCKSGEPVSLLGYANIQWIDADEGTFTLKVARAITAKWPTDLVLLMDISVRDPDGIRIRSESVEFKTEKGVTENL